MTNELKAHADLADEILEPLRGPLTLADVRDRAVLRIEEAAEVMGVSRQVAYREIRAGRWPSIRLGRSVRVPVPALRRALGDLED